MFCFGFVKKFVSVALLFNFINVILPRCSVEDFYYFVGRMLQKLMDLISYSKFYHLGLFIFNFKYLLNLIQCLLTAGVYSMCDGPALSHGPYLGTVTLCSFLSILLLSVKACVFTVNSQIEAEASYSLSRQKLHLKKSWGMPVLFLSSVVFALGHTVVAYRTSCRARRKLLFHRVDADTVSLHSFCPVLLQILKYMFAYQKVRCL